MDFLVILEVQGLDSGPSREFRPYWGLGLLRGLGTITRGPGLDFGPF